MYWYQKAPSLLSRCFSSSTDVSFKLPLLLSTNKLHHLKGVGTYWELNKFRRPFFGATTNAILGIDNKEGNAAKL